MKQFQYTVVNNITGRELGAFTIYSNSIQEALKGAIENSPFGVVVSIKEVK